MPKADEQDFRDAIAPLANYRRTVAWEYVKSLRAEIAQLESSNSVLAKRVIELEGSLPNASIPSHHLPRLQCEPRGRWQRQHHDD